MNKELFISSLFMMDSAKGGNFYGGSVEGYFTQGIKLAPTNFTLHLWYALNIRPRWGGTQTQWNELRESTKMKISAHPHLSVIDAVWSAMYSDMEKRNGNLDKALEYINDAISKGHAADFFYQKYIILHEKNDMDSAINSLLKALAMKPGNSSYLEELSVYYRGTQTGILA